MPLKKNLKKIAVIGSGPIVIGQACEFDYSGVQACKALKGLGLEVVLINSNPATVMTDPEIASKVYIEPLTFDFVKKILERERPDGLISTLGGQTALNLSLELSDKGVLKELNTELLGATAEVIREAEDRERFAALLSRLGARCAQSRLIKNFKEGLRAVKDLDFPLILRPNFTLGGGGGGAVYSLQEFQEQLFTALSESPTSEVLVEKSLLGYKEFELEVMRDSRGTFVVICSIENIDPCGVHTGDSVTVAPQMTLSDRAYQAMRNEARTIIEALKLNTGGANIQFAVHPQTGERLVIEVNPRVSRSSALAGKATGFPIAKISALLAAGFTLDEIPNDITKATLSCYEPALDYVVTKAPRFDFQKYPGARDLLGTQMQSVGEAMAIGRTFKESFLKAREALELSDKYDVISMEFSKEKLSRPNSRRMDFILEAFRRGMSLPAVHDLSRIDPWFLNQFLQITETEKQFADKKNWNPAFIRSAKRTGFSDKAIAKGFQRTENEVFQFRKKNGIRPAFFQVDTCAGEFASSTPYFYSTYWGAVKPGPGSGGIGSGGFSSGVFSSGVFSSGVFSSGKSRKKQAIAVIGAGPNRIGQGVEFDYNCVRGVKTLKQLGFETILVNSNPETVSTDYDTSDKLFFEPVTKERVREVLHWTQASALIPQLGGQTPIDIASDLHKEGFKICGSSVKTIDLAEDRARFAEFCARFGFQIPKSVSVSGLKEARIAASRLKFPLIARPSYVLGGRRMEIIENPKELQNYFKRHGGAGGGGAFLMEEYLEDFLEADVDMVRGADWSLVGGVLEHIESAGVHSGDSMGVIPPQTLSDEAICKIESLSLRLADELNVIGFLNLQLAVKGRAVYMIEANPRSSRSLPFISKATGIPLGDLGAKAMAGLRKKEVRPELFDWKNMKNVFVKGVVFPFKKLKRSDSLLGPEMKSIGEVMGRGADYAEALVKALAGAAGRSAPLLAGPQQGAPPRFGLQRGAPQRVGPSKTSSRSNSPSGKRFPRGGEIFLSLNDKDKAPLLQDIKKLSSLGYSLSATKGTARWLESCGVPCLSANKVHEGRPHCADRIQSGAVVLALNTSSFEKASIEASFSIRRSCIDYDVPCLTHINSIKAFILALGSGLPSDPGLLPVRHLTEERTRA